MHSKFYHNKMSQRKHIDLFDGAIMLNSKMPDMQSHLDYDFEAARQIDVQKGVPLNYAAIQKAFGVNAAIQMQTPKNSVIMDVGAGHISRFTPDELAAKGQTLVNLDHIYSGESMRPHDDNLTVALDLVTLPNFMARLPLDRALRIIQTQVPESLREQIKLFIQMVQTDNIGAYIFSHSLQYLEDEDALNALSIAIKNIRDDGSIFLCDKTSAFYSTAMAKKKATTKFHLAYQLCKPHQIAEDILAAPALTPDQIVTMQEIIKATSAWDAQIKLDEWISSGEVALVSLNGREKDNGATHIALPDGRKVLLVFGERILTMKPGKDL